MSIPHHAHCPRPAPHLRLGWTGNPEAWCPGCGRSGPADDQRNPQTGCETLPDAAKQAATSCGRRASESVSASRTHQLPVDAAGGARPMKEAS